MVFNAATKDGSALPNLTFDFGIRELSDPIDPILEDPIGAPPPVDLPIATSPPVYTPPPDRILDPIANPFIGLA